MFTTFLQSDLINVKLLGEKTARLRGASNKRIYPKLSNMQKLLGSHQNTQVISLPSWSYFSQKLCDATDASDLDDSNMQELPSPHLPPACTTLTGLLHSLLLVESRALTHPCLHPPAWQKVLHSRSSLLPILFHLLANHLPNQSAKNIRMGTQNNQGI